MSKKLYAMKMDGKDVVGSLSGTFEDMPVLENLKEVDKEDPEDEDPDPIEEGPEFNGPLSGPVDSKEREEDAERLRIRRNIDSMEKAKLEQAVANLEDDMIRERYHTEFMRSLEKNRRNDMDAAVSHYGEEADLEGIVARYDYQRDKKLNRIKGPLGALSMIVGNELAGPGSRQMVELKEGGTRMMNYSTAEAIARNREPFRKILTPGGTVFKKTEKDESDGKILPDILTDGKENEKGALESIVEAIPDKADAEFEKIDTMEATFESDVRYFEHLLSRHVVEEHRLRYAYPYSGYMSPQQFREHIVNERIRAMKEQERRIERESTRSLPMVAQDYAYVFKNIETMMKKMPEGRKIPQAMYAMEMQPEVQKFVAAEMGASYVPNKQKQNEMSL